MDNIDESTELHQIRKALEIIATNLETIRIIMEERR